MSHRQLQCCPSFILEDLVADRVWARYNKQHKEGDQCLSKLAVKLLVLHFIMWHYKRIRVYYINLENFPLDSLNDLKLCNESMQQF